MYDQALQSKITANSFKEANKKIAVRMKFLEKELLKRDQVIEDLMGRPKQYPAYSSPNIVSKHHKGLIHRSIEGGLVTSLKKRVQDLQKEVKVKDRVINDLKMDARGTKMREITVEKTAFENECK